MSISSVCEDGQARTLYEKLWEAHCVKAGPDGEPDLIYIDRHLLHEVTSPQAFAELERRDLN